MLFTYLHICTKVVKYIDSKGSHLGGVVVDKILAVGRRRVLSSGCVA